MIIRNYVRRQLSDTIFKLRDTIYLNDYKAGDVPLTRDNQRFPWQTSQKYSWKKIVSTTIEQYFIIEDYFSNRKIKCYFKNHIMKFIKIVWSLHCLRLLHPEPRLQLFSGCKNISTFKTPTQTDCLVYTWSWWRSLPGRQPVCSSATCPGSRPAS